MINLFRSKSVWGVIIAVLGWLFSPEVLATMPHAVSVIAQAVGAILAAFGFRSAIAKAARNIPQ